MESDFLTLQQAVFVPRSTLESCAQITLKSFNDVYQSYVVELLNPAHLSMHNESVVCRLPDSDLLILTLLSWDITWINTWNIDACSFKCRLRTQTPFPYEQETKRMHNQYSRFTVQRLKKKEFKNKIEDLLNKLDAFFETFLVKVLEPAGP